MQTAATAWSERLVNETDEDCLSLNVWTPALDDRRRPVLVWFHGGAFLIGARSSYNSAVRPVAATWWSSPSTIALGSSAGCGIDVCGEALPSTGNNGHYDQLAALEWVRAEIASFGGDPSNVTVFGQSAGAGKHHRHADDATSVRALVSASTGYGPGADMALSCGRLVQWSQIAPLIAE